MSEIKKAAIILFNLGGPDSKAAIRPFLVNFFTDPNIIRLPYIFRRAIAELIAARRTKKEAGTSYGLLGDKSPLLENTQAQAAALEEKLRLELSGYDIKTFVCMRYWHPMADQVVQDVKAFAPDEIVLLPLYPQYSTTTTRSSLEDWQKACQTHGLSVSTSTICCYPFGAGFIEASAQLVKTAYLAAQVQLEAKGLPAPRILFSAHGLPESIIKEGDPYQWQCEQAAEKIAAAMNLPDLDWQICYQSRVGPKKWLGPSTEDALHKAAKDQVPVLVYPHAFVSEHVETLVEIEQEYRHVADEIGVPWFGRVETVGTASRFIDGLADMVTSSLGTRTLAPDTKKRLCPMNFSQCCMAEFPNGV